MSEMLLGRWLEDRGSLGEEEAVELLRALEADPELARHAKEQLGVDELLSRRLAGDRGRFEDQVAQRIRIVAGDTFPEATLRALDRRVRGRSALRLWAAEAAAAALLLGVLLFFLARREPAAVPATSVPGLRAEYYRGRDFSGEPLRRVEAAIDFAWAMGKGPRPESGDIFSARLTGTLRAKVSGLHELRVRNDDGVRVWIDGALVIDDWKERLFISESRSSVLLEAGREHALRVEYYNAGAQGLLELYWSASGLPEERIPASQYSHE